VEDVTKKGLWLFFQVPYRVQFVAVDCIALNYLGKHTRKMVFRTLNQQESNQQQ